MERNLTSERDPQDTKRRQAGERASYSHEQLAPDESSERKRRVSASSKDDMQRSTSPSGSSSIKLTKTGRVSKATKGQRVHHCEDCGKTYTRNEHLRRHQQNHKPGAFPCDIPGCGRSFYREDLLLRHKTRHSDPDDPLSRRESLVSEGSPGFSARTLPTAPPADAALPTDPQNNLSTSRSPVSTSLSPAPTTQQDVHRPDSRVRKGYIPLNELPPAPVAITLNTRQPFHNPYFNNVNWDPSPPCSPDDSLGTSMDTNAHLEQQGLFFPQEHWSTPSSQYHCDVNMLRSPVSADATTQIPSWGTSVGDYSQESTGSSETSFGLQGHSDCSNLNGQPWLNDPLPQGLSAEQRDFMEQDELATPLFGPQADDFGPNLQNDSFGNNEQRYLAAYWESIHSLWPVIHKPTYTTYSASPLLRASIFALGAHAMSDQTDIVNGRTLHDRCSKVLQKRTIRNWHTYRTCDIQAVLLVEIYSIFRSRRPPLQLSSSFKCAYEALAHDPVANPAMMAFAMDPLLGGNTGVGAFDGGLEQESRKRLLAAYYLLDCQHATLFGRSTITTVSLSPDSLPFPRHQGLWDTMLTQQFTPYGYDPDAPSYELMLQARMAAESSSGMSDAPHDLFGSMMLLAGMTEDPQLNASAIGTEERTCAFKSVAERSPRTNLAHHATMLCKHASIRDLLAVAGESWVMAEKMRSQADYSAAQISVKSWAGGFDDESSNSYLALKHALNIIKIHQQCTKIGLLFDEWALHLASTVIWARAFTSMEHHRHPRLPVSSSDEPRASSHELNRCVSRILQAGADASIAWEDAKGLLLWSKVKLERANASHACGLTNGALDVLGKLILRGDEEGCWF